MKEKSAFHTEWNIKIIVKIAREKIYIKLLI